MVDTGVKTVKATFVHTNEKAQKSMAPVRAANTLIRWFIDLGMNNTQKIIEAKNLEPAQKRFLASMIQTTYLQYLLRYEDLKKQAYFKANNIPQKQWRQSKYKVDMPDKNYYSFLKEIIKSKAVPKVADSLFYATTTLFQLIDYKDY